jgi:hypothetical protein
MSEVEQDRSPRLRRKAFVCPREKCGAYTQQTWKQLQEKRERLVNAGEPYRPSSIWVATCFVCRYESYWLALDRDDTAGETPLGLMLHPTATPNTGAPAPHPDMPDDLATDYAEAAAIVGRSPRAAAALLRLVLQKLGKELGGGGKRIDDDIGAMKAAGMSSDVVEAMDTVRILGNNALHPGELDLRDDRTTAIALFGIVNFIVRQTISERKERDKLRKLLPQGALEAIDRRDAKAEVGAPEGGSAGPAA